MARKKNDDGFLYLLALLGLVILSIFLINSICVYQHYNNQYKFRQSSARVTDTWNIFRFMPVIILLGFLSFAIINAGVDLNNGSFQSAVILLIFVVILLVFIVFPFLMVSARLATTQAGLLIFRERGYFVIPTDWNKNTFSENIFQLKIIAAMFSMECLKLADIKKITREGGKIAFVHGNFGTRRIAWRNKQKRDECIAALENACGKRLGSHI